MKDKIMGSSLFEGEPSNCENKEKEFSILCYGFIDNEHKYVKAHTIEEALGKIFNKLEKIKDNFYLIENDVTIVVDGKGRKPNCYVVEVRVRMDNLNYCEDENEFNLVLRKGSEYKKFKVDYVKEFTDNFPVIPIMNFIKKELSVEHISFLNSVKGVRPFFIDFKVDYNLFVKDGVLFIV